LEAPVGYPQDAGTDPVAAGRSGQHHPARDLLPRTPAVVDLTDALPLTDELSGLKPPKAERIDAGGEARPT